MITRLRTHSKGYVLNRFRIVWLRSWEPQTGLQCLLPPRDTITPVIIMIGASTCLISSRQLGAKSGHTPTTRARLRRVEVTLCWVWARGCGGSTASPHALNFTENIIKSDAALFRLLFSQSWLHSQQLVGGRFIPLHRFHQSNKKTVVHILKSLLRRCFYDAF